MHAFISLDYDFATIMRDPNHQRVHLPCSFLIFSKVSEYMCIYLKKIRK